MTKISEDIQNKILQAAGHSPIKDEGSCDITLDDINSFGNQETLSTIDRDIASYNKMLKEKITFINDDLTELIPFTRENLYLMCGYTGNGKCFKKGQGILLYDGSVKNVEDIVVGDQVMGPDSKPRNVLSLARGREQMYDIVPKKGSKYTVNESHLLSLRNSKGRVVNIPVKEYLKKSAYFKHTMKGYRSAVDFKEKQVFLNPYYLGLWLGDGNSNNTGVTTIDSEVVDFIYKKLSDLNDESMFIRVQDKSNTNAKCYHYSTGNKSGKHNRNIVLNELKSLNLINNKHIPMLYKTNSREVRLRLLAGLVDSDGGGKPCIDFNLKSKVLAEDIVYLCRSLGFAAYMKETKKRATNSNNKELGIYYRINVSGNLDEIPTKIPRKRYPKRRQIKNVLNVGIEVIPTTVNDYYGFSVDGDHLFLLDDFTVTHNSTCAANISYALWKEGKKTLVISNEESQQDVLLRIACLDLGYNFNDYKKGNMGADKLVECRKLFEDIAKHVKVVDVTYRNGLTTKYEGIVNALEMVKGADFSAAMIDYYQLIQNSVNHPGKDRYSVLNDLRIYLQRYIRKSNIPIVLFAQLHSMGKRNNVELDSRVKECPTILEAATVVLEMIPNFEDRATYFLIKKDRFGLQGEKIICGFDKGKFVRYDDNFKSMVEMANLNKAMSNVGEDDNGEQEEKDEQ